MNPVVTGIVCVVLLGAAFIAAYLMCEGVASLGRGYQVAQETTEETPPSDDAL